jgi:ATP-binding cassette subfamily B protein
MTAPDPTAELAPGTGPRSGIGGLIPGLGAAPPDVQAFVASCLVEAHFGFGDEIVRAGDAGRQYVLLSGTARAVVGHGPDEVHVATLGPGDVVGAPDIGDAPFPLTVRASEPVRAVLLDTAVLRGLGASYPEVGAALAAPARRLERRAVLRLHLPQLEEVEPERIGALVDALRSVRAGPGDVVADDSTGERTIWIVRDGRLVAERRDDGAIVAYLRAGDVFGGGAVAGRPAVRVRAVSHCDLLALDEQWRFSPVNGGPPPWELLAAIAARGARRPDPRVPLDFAGDVEVPGPAPAWGPAAGGDGAVPDDGASRNPADAVATDPAVEPAFTRPRRRIRRLPVVYGVDEMDCGPAALAVVCRHFGRRVSVAAVREATATAIDGTSLLGLEQGATRLGLRAQSLKVSASRLDELPMPAIVHWDANHWLVLQDVGRRWVRVVDPMVGPRRFTRTEFLERWSGYTLLLAPTPRLQEVPEDTAGLRWILGFLRPERPALLAVAGLALVSATATLLVPYSSQLIIDQVIVDDDPAMLNVIMLGICALLVASIVAAVVERYVMTRATLRIDRATLDHVSGKLLDMPLLFFQARRTGDIERRLNGLREVRQLFLQQGVQALTAAATLVVALGLMFWNDVGLALLYLTVAPVYGLLMVVAARRLRPVFDSLEESWGRYKSRQIDAIKGIDTVKAAGAEPHVRGLLLRQFDELAGRLFRADFTMMLVEGALGLLSFVPLALVMWVGARQVLDGDLTIGAYVAFIALVVLTTGPVVILFSTWDVGQYARVLVTRLADLVQHDPEQGVDHGGLLRVTTLEGRVRLERVGFHYAGPLAAPVLEDVSLSVEPGSTVAIVGRSGAGKTTLVKCLAGLLEPTTGVIEHDGIDLTTLEYRSLRRQIGIVLQDNHLFDDTIARNIAFGDDEPDPGRVEWAARIANADGFVRRLPLGYATRIGETGMRLSGGQRQRIAIARAVYHDPPVLVFDEATSTLDAESERAVQRNLATLLRGRTAFVVAHRLSTVRTADVIVVLEQGRLVEQGTHRELMRRRGLYHHLVSTQLEE